MCHCRIYAICLVLILAIVSASASEPGTLHAWFVDSLIKVFPGDLAGKHRLVTPEFSAPRNRNLSIQFAVRSAEPLSAVTAEVTPLRGTKGESITGVVARSVGYVVVGSHSIDTPPEELVGEAPGWYPDLLGNFPIRIERNRSL